MLKFKCKKVNDSVANPHAVNEISLIFFNNDPKVNDLMDYLKDEYIKRSARDDFDKDKFNKLILNNVSEFIKDKLKEVEEDNLWQNTANRLAFAEKVQERIKDIVEFEEPEIEVEDEDLENPLDELPLDKERMFQFDNGEYLYIDYADGKLFAGSATNTGIFHDYEIDYDFDATLDDNLEKLYEVIIEAHPEYLDTPVDDTKDTIENVEVKDEDEFEFEDGVKIIVSPHTAWATGAFSFECDIYKNDLYIGNKYVMGVDDAEEAANYAYSQVKETLDNLEVEDSKYSEQAYLIYDLCNKFNFYTHGDAYAYENMLNNCNTWSIGAIAQDISKHSLPPTDKYSPAKTDISPKNIARLIREVAKNENIKFKDSINDTLNVVEIAKDEPKADAPKLVKFLFEDEIYNFELNRCKHIVEVYDLLYDMAYTEDLYSDPRTEEILKYVMANKEVAMSYIIRYLYDLYIGKSGEDLLKDPKETDKELEVKPSTGHSVKSLKA